MIDLITGASGFIGRRLLQPGDRGLMMHTGVRGDLLDPSPLVSACEGIGTIFHCAGYAHAFSSSDPDAHRRINCEGTRNLLNSPVRIERKLGWWAWIGLAEGLGEMLPIRGGDQ